MSRAANAIDHSRRNFLRGRMRPRDLPLPWVDEAAFTEGCTTCGDCVAACPEHIIRPGEGGLPTVDFGRSGCSFCSACAEACAEDLFDLERDPPWHLTIEISDSCLTKKGVVCESCRDICEMRAIAFPPRIGGPAEPRLDPTRCTACGACVSACPAQAIAARRAPDAQERARA